MSTLYRPQVITYRLRDGSYRDSNGKRVTSTTRGAVRHVGRSPFWWGRYTDANGHPQQVKLYRSKEQSRDRLRDLEARAVRSRIAGIPESALERKSLPLLAHLDAFEAELKTGRSGKRKRPPSAKHVLQTINRIKRILAGCGFRTLSDLARHDTLATVQEFLDGITTAKPQAELPNGVEEFTRAELAQALGITPAGVTWLVVRHRLEGKGNGPSRRYPRATAEALLQRAAQGIGSCTAGFYAQKIKSFTKWLTDNQHLARDPLATMPGASPASDHRRDRRALADAELRKLIATAAASTWSFRGLAGRPRSLLYATAAATGFRAEELASLDVGSFDLASQAPTVTLRAAVAKNGKAACQPLPADLADELRTYLGQRTNKDARAWPGKWWRRGAEMLRADLEDAGIPYATEGPEGPLYADLHSLRHTFVAMLDRAGVSLKQAMQLARHSDPKLTMARYGRAALHDLSAAVDQLPPLFSEPQPVDKSKRARAAAAE